MDNSINSGKHMLEILAADSDFVASIPMTKIFPLIAPAETGYPFIIYSRDSLTTTYTKAAPFGGWVNEILMTYRIYTDNYDEGLEIASNLRKALEWHEYTDEGIVIKTIQISSGYEQFTEDGYCQTLTFSATVQ